MKPEYFFPLYGGALIGLACTLFLYFHGKILGISGIVGGLFDAPKKDRTWRLFFLLGLLCGGRIVHYFRPHAFDFALDRSVSCLILAGVLVGLGTRIGNGCTSGHGVCGISRLSPRSFIATISFIACGALTVFIIEHFFGGVV